MQRGREKKGKREKGKKEKKTYERVGDEEDPFELVPS